MPPINFIKNISIIIIYVNLNIKVIYYDSSQKYFLAPPCYNLRIYFVNKTHTKLLGTMHMQFINCSTPRTSIFQRKTK